jgi:uncharacterized protein YdeI (YjbR/CyaY-like superfamily)
VPSNIKKVFQEVQPNSAADWRQWLEANHLQKDSIWLVLAKKESGIPSLSVSEAVDEALCFGWVDSLPNKVDEKRFKILVSPRKPKSNWSKVNKDKVERLLAERKMAAAGLQMVALAKQNGTWDALNEVDSLRIPNDLAAKLAEYPQATAYFENFPPSTRRGILEWILNAKQPQTRAKRINETAALAAENKRANQYIKG